jgi:hypothetical protein
MLFSQFLKLKVSLNESIGGITDNHTIRRSQPLYSRSNVWRFSQGNSSCLLTPPISPTTTNPVWMPRRIAKSDTFGLFKTSIQYPYRFDHPQPGMDGTLGVFLVCHRVAKIDE